MFREACLVQNCLLRLQHWTKAEENLLALGLQQFGHCGQQTLPLVHHYVLPTRSARQMRMHRQHLARSASMPHPLLRLLANRSKKTSATDESAYRAQLALTSILDHVSEGTGCLWNRSEQWCQLPPVFLYHLRSISCKELLNRVPNTKLRTIELTSHANSYFIYL